jgi:hypothetical protein
MITRSITANRNIETIGVVKLLGICFNCWLFVGDHVDRVVSTANQWDLSYRSVAIVRS